MLWVFAGLCFLLLATNVVWSNSKDFSPDNIESSCAKSIRNLNCDYLDIFQLHGITESQITEPLIERLLSILQLLVLSI